MTLTSCESAHVPLSGLQTIPVGSYQVRLTTSGTKDVLISANSLSIQSGQVATVLVLDNPTAGGAPAAFVVPDGGDLSP